MLFRIRCTETSSTEIIVKADTEQDALMRVDAALDDERERRLLFHWLSRGYCGIDAEVVGLEDEDQEHDDWDFCASKEIVVDPGETA
jgi:hypothetical protein